MSDQNPCFIPFAKDVSGIDLPDRFTFPFYYTPHPLCLLASAQLQEVIVSMDWKHDFGVETPDSDTAIGKMFGVLVVQTNQGNLGFLAAFSGKVADENLHHPFVPPVFNMLDKDGFFKREEAVISELNNRIDHLLGAAEYINTTRRLAEAKRVSESKLTQLRKEVKKRKLDRKLKRTEAAQTLSLPEIEVLEANLVKESLDDQFNYKRSAKKWRLEINELESKHALFVDSLNRLKEERKSRSGALQKELFDCYKFLNANGKEENVLDIFEVAHKRVPPTGAGECAAPKLLQYAYLNQFKPIAMAEFWWGASDKSEVRKQGQFYPACRGKCEPILNHMLQGLMVDPNPIFSKLAEEKEIEILFEDAHLLVINKPQNLLTIPGKEIEDSVLTRIGRKYPEASGPLVVHRLDMSTSGILLIAKTKEVHKALQQQFENRTVRKRYTALLDGELFKDNGTVDLPLRVDFHDRPRQLVCFEHGKPSTTYWELVGTEKHGTRVRFFPITGRTHQLRMHAAHHLGLSAPIVGDELYGKQGARLHLHADQITFVHPLSGHEMTIESQVPF